MKTSVTQSSSVKAARKMLLKVSNTHVIEIQQYQQQHILYNSVFLSPSLCTKRSILSGRGNSTDAMFEGIPS
jgi:hypothetical protein